MEMKKETNYFSSDSRSQFRYIQFWYFSIKIRKRIWLW